MTLVTKLLVISTWMEDPSFLSLQHKSILERIKGLSYQEKNSGNRK